MQVNRVILKIDEREMKGNNANKAIKQRDKEYKLAFSFCRQRRFLSNRLLAI